MQLQEITLKLVILMSKHSYAWTVHFSLFNKQINSKVFNQVVIPSPAVGAVLFPARDPLLS